MGSIITTLIISSIVYFVIAINWISIICYYPESDFDKLKWSINKEKRYELSEDIIESKMLIGKTKVVERKLLGEEGNSMESDLWGHNLGYVSGIVNIDPDYLDIKFKNGRLVVIGTIRREMSLCF